MITGYIETCPSSWFWKLCQERACQAQIAEQLDQEERISDVIRAICAMHAIRVIPAMRTIRTIRTILILRTICKISTYIHAHIHKYRHTYIHAYIHKYLPHTCVRTYMHTRSRSKEINSTSINISTYIHEPGSRAFVPSPHGRTLYFGRSSYRLTCNPFWFLFWRPFCVTWTPFRLQFIVWLVLFW